jgi:uncharacterized protein (DUF1697 family)
LDTSCDSFGLKPNPNRLRRFGAVSLFSSRGASPEQKLGIDLIATYYPPHMPAKYLALLRGVNVGGKNRVPMKDLGEIFRDEGCAEVRTFIQSGNVVFQAVEEVRVSLGSVLPARIREAFGCTVPVVFRNLPQMEAVTLNNPFLNAGESEDLAYVAFLRDLPSAENVASLDPDRSPPDRFAIVGADVYLHLPAGIAKTKLTNAYFDSKLKTVSTGRNWRTVRKLVEMMQE